MAGLKPTFVELEAPGRRDLLDLARAGDAEAFGEVYRAYATRLLRQAVALCGNVALAEELAQDTLVEAWRCLRRYNGRCAFFTWLCAILLNRYRNSLRERRLRGGGHEEFRAAVERLADHGSAPDEAAELCERTALVRKCIETLPAKLRQVVFLRFYVDDSLEGIAVSQGCSVGTVKSRLFRALDKLRGMNALNVEVVDLKPKG